MTELFTNFKPCAEWADLSGTHKDIQARLLPSTDHHVEIRTQHPGLSAFDIERSILRGWKRNAHINDYGKPGRYGLYFWQHFLLFMSYLIPSTIITPSFVDEAIAMEIAMAEQIDLVNYIGAKSTGKSAWMSRAALTLIAIDPEYSRAYFAAPYKNVADFTVWAETVSCFQEIEKHHKDVFPDAKYTASVKLIQMQLGQAKAGRADLVGLDNVGKLQGAKSRDPERGWFLLVADEIAVWQNQDFIQILDNITGNPNFLGFDGCNFKNTLGMDGVLCNPRKREYQDLNPDLDHIWLSDYNSITLRLDGHCSPNVKEKRVIYPFLLTETKRSNMETQHTQLGPKYLEQIRSFPHAGVTDEFVLSMDRLRSGGAFDTAWWKSTGQWTRVAFLDPGWQGDPCKIGCFEFGPGKVQTHEGGLHEMTIFRPIGPIETLKVQVGLRADHDFLVRLNSVSDSPVLLKVDMEVTMDLQIAVQTAEFLKKHNIAKSNFGFDSSMRGSIVQEMATVLGPQIVVYDFAALPTEMVVDHEGHLAKDKYRNLRSEIYFTIQLMVAGSQLRDGGFVMDALGQVCRHKVVAAGMKQAIEPKIKYKESNQGKSPDAADVLAGACHMARRRGMNLAFNRSARERFSSSFEDLPPTIRPRPSFAKLKT